MRVYVRSIMVAFVLLAAMPQPAHAGIMAFLDYLDNLSGPGPFLGPGVEVPLLCDGTSGVTWKCLKFGLPDKRYRRFEVGPHFSFLNGRINRDLNYPAGTSDDSKDVDVTVYGVQATMNFSDKLGATVRLTGYRFGGPLVENGHITRTVFGVGPVARLHVGSGSLYLGVTPIMYVGFGEFEAADFGALGPELESDHVKFVLHIGLYF